MAGEHAGQSIIEMLWEAAVFQYNKLNDLHEETGGVTADSLAEMFKDGMRRDAAEESSAEVVAYLQTQGKLVGLCYALAKMLNPYEPDLDGVKAQVREQWESAQEEEDGE